MMRPDWAMVRTKGGSDFHLCVNNATSDHSGATVPDSHRHSTLAEPSRYHPNLVGVNVPFPRSSRDRPAKMTLHLSLICHASTDALRTNTFPADEPLDRPGLAAAHAAAGSLSAARRCLTSPALRARQTATALGLIATVDDGLNDYDCGRWKGCRLKDLQEQVPEGVMAWMSDPASTPHGGESVLDLLDRIGAWLDGLGTGNQSIVAVTHAAVIRAAIIHAIRATPRSFWRIDVTPLSRTELRASSGQWRLRSTGSVIGQSESQGSS